MRHTARIARLGGLAVGLGIGAALAATPGTAAADPFSSLFGDLAVSIDGIPLFQEGDATATSGLGDFAIAIGAGSNASATGGIMDFALADAGGTASASGSLDSANAIGLGSDALAGFGSIGSVAIADGANSSATATDGFMNFASVFGANSVATATLGDCDTAEVFGTNSAATAGDIHALAVVLGDVLTATANGDFLTDIVPGLLFWGPVPLGLG